MSRSPVLFVVLVLAAACTSSSSSATEQPALVDVVPDPSVVESVQTTEAVEPDAERDRTAEAQRIRDVDACDGEDAFSCAVLDTVAFAASDLLCLAWDDVNVAEHSRGTFAEAAIRDAEEDDRFAGSEALRIATLEIIEEQLGEIASDGALSAVESLRVLPLDLPIAREEVEGHLDELARILDPACE